MATPTPVTSAARIRRVTVASISAVLILLPSRRLTAGCCPIINNPKTVVVANTVNVRFISQSFLLRRAWAFGRERAGLRSSIRSLAYATSANDILRNFLLLLTRERMHSSGDVGVRRDRVGMFLRNCVTRLTFSRA